MSDDLSYAEKLEAERIGSDSPSYDEYQESQDDDSGGSSDDNDTSGSPDSSSDSTDDRATPEAGSDQKLRNLADEAEDSDTGDSSSGGSGSLDTSDNTLPDSPTEAQPDNPFDDSADSSSSGGSSGDFSGGSDSNGGSSSSDDGDDSQDRVTPEGGSDQKLQNLADDARDSNDDSGSNPPVGNTPSSGNLPSQSGSSPETGQGIGPDGVSGSEAATPDAETDASQNDSTDGIEATRTGRLEDTASDPRVREQAQQIEQELVGKKITDLSDNLNATGAELRKEDVEVVPIDSEGNVVDDFSKADRVRRQLSPVGRERIENISDRQAAEQAERAVEDKLNTAFSGEDVSVNDDGSVDVSQDVQNEAVEQEIAESNSGVRESDISFENGDPQVDQPDPTEKAAADIERQTNLDQGEDFTVSRDAPSSRVPTERGQGDLNIDLTEQGQAELREAREGAVTTEIDRFEQVVDRYEKLTGQDVPGEGDLLPGQINLSKGIENRTGVDLPESAGSFVASQAGINPPSEEEAIKNALSAVERAATRSTRTFSNTNIPFTDTEYSEVGSLGPQGTSGSARSVAQTASDTVDAATDTDIPFTNTEFGDADELAREAKPDRGDVSDAVRSAVGTDIPFTDTAYSDSEELLREATPDAVAAATDTATSTDVPFTDTEYGEAEELPREATSDAVDAATDTANSTDVPFTDTAFNESGELVREAIPSQQRVSDAVSSATGANIPFTETEYSDAGSLIPEDNSPDGANPVIFEAMVEAEKQINDVPEQEARENVAKDVQAVDESTVDSFSPAVGRSPASGINAARGIGIIAGLAGGATVADELIGGRNNNELEPGDPAADRNELEPGERAVGRTEVEISERSSEVNVPDDPSIGQDEVQVNVGQQTRDIRRFKLEQQILIGKQDGDEQEDGQSPTIGEDVPIQDRPGRIGRGLNRGQRLNRNRGGGISDISRDRVEESQVVVDDDPIVQREIATGESAVVGEGSSTVDEATDRLEEAQKQDLVRDQSQGQSASEVLDTRVGPRQRDGSVSDTRSPTDIETVLKSFQGPTTFSEASTNIDQTQDTVRQRDASTQTESNPNQLSEPELNLGPAGPGNGRFNKKIRLPDADDPSEPFKFGKQSDEQPQRSARDGDRGAEPGWFNEYVAAVAGTDRGPAPGIEEQAEASVADFGTLAVASQDTEEFQAAAAFLSGEGTGVEGFFGGDDGLL